MKNAEYWFRKVKNKKFRELLFHRMNESDNYCGDSKYESLKEAIITGFSWRLTPDGLNFWSDLYHNPKKLEELTNKQIENMKLEELKKQYQKLGDEIARLEEKEWWKDGGYAVNGYGSVLYFNMPDLRYYKQCRLFKTEEEAEKFNEKEKLLAEISREEGARPFIASEYNFSLKYDYKNKIWFGAITHHIYSPNTIYFERKEQTQKAIQKYGTKLNILL